MPNYRSFKRAAAAFLCGALALGLAACQENPEGTIVAHKDMEKLISQAGEAGSSVVGAQDLVNSAKQMESYQTTIENENLNVKITVDAQVDVPEVEKLSIYRVQQKKFSQDFLDKVRAELLGGKALYDGAALDIRTKSQIEADIQSLREAMSDESLRNEVNPDEMTEEEVEETLQEFRDSYQREIDNLQEQYESAPDQVDVTQHLSDGQIKSIQEQLAAKPDSSYYQWQSELDSGEDQVFYGITDGADGDYQVLYAQNNADYSNKLVYRRSPRGYVHVGGVVVGSTPLKPYYSAREMAMTEDYAEYWGKKGVPEPVISGGLNLSSELSFEQIGSGELRLTLEEAQAQAEEFLQKLGLEDFRFSEGGQFSELMTFDNWESADVPYQVYYVLRYTRELEGVLLTQSSGEKFQANWDSSQNYNKQMWPGENIELRIDDSGIVGFDYNAPLEVTETVVEGSSLKSFDEVKGIFEQMLPVVLGSKDWDKVAKVDRVRLSYSRISEKDSFDTGLVVPVWSFEGDVSFYSEGYLSHAETGTLLAVNAIDGSIIDAELGY